MQNNSKLRSSFSVVVAWLLIAIPQGLRKALAAEQQARLEAEEQLRETLEVMQLLKQCLQDHKEKSASLEYHVKELQELQRQQKEEQLQRAFEASQSAAILEALDREQNTRALQTAQETVSTAKQEDQPCKASICQDSPETVKKEVMQSGTKHPAITWTLRVAPAA